MSDALLHVITATLSAPQEVPAVLRMLRHFLPGACAEGRAALLFCDLCDAQGERMPGDAQLLSLLQSGVMAIDARSPARFMLLVRRRAWDDAQRMYLGAGQKRSARSVIADLLLDGRTDAVFDAATVSPAALRGAFAAVLFSPLSLSCTPDTPARMRDALAHSPGGAVGAQVVSRRAYPRSALMRLSGFSLSPLSLIAQSRRRGLVPGDEPDVPVIFAVSALRDAPVLLPPAPGCSFVRRESATLRSLFAEHRASCMRKGGAYALLAPAQLALLFLAALSGQGFWALLSFLPESPALLSPRRLPCSLVRLALLPVTAFVSLDALLMRLLARSRLLRLRVPAFFQRPHGCALTGGALLLAAVRGTHALPILLPTALLWLAAPLIHSALDSPTSERLPLSSEQTAQLRALAEDAFFDALSDEQSSPQHRMLAACAGSMLSLLEPDEAARRAELLLAEAMQSPKNTKTAADVAAALVSAQVLREAMGQCDAALRDLPAKLEAHALEGQILPEGSALHALLLAAGGDTASTDTRRTSGEEPPALNALFLPLGPARETPMQALTLPLTHPHTYLQREAQDKADGGTLRPADRFLALVAAALDHPFYPLLLRSPVVGPYAALLSL